MLSTEIISSTDIYWITRCSYIQGAFIGLSILSGVLTIVFWFAYFGEARIEGLWCRWVMTILTFIFILSACAMPNTEEMAAIKVIPMIVNNDNVQNVSKEIIDLSKQWLEDLKPRDYRR